MTHSCLQNKLVCRLVSFSLAAVSYLAAGVTARAANLVQEFFLPMPEAQIYQANNAIISGTGSTIASTFSIVVTGDGTVIYYDQWEDGYETDLANPVQATTKIWGDGNDAHGIPPGFAHNPLGLPAGTVITLTNSVTLPRNPSTILWDARDRVAANKALVISRAGWPIPTGPVFAGAVGVLSTMDYGTNYISPVGQNLPNNLFKYVGMFIMAAQNNTAVTIDPNGTGVGTTSIVLNQGESYLVNGGILKGGRVTATKPIQADLIIGHVGAAYASDWFTLYPVESWDDSYYTPVGTSAGGNPAYVYLYNPGTNAITINYNTRVGSGSFSVPGTNGVFQFQMPVGSGASFVSAGGQNFFAVCTVAANNSADTAYNWGFTLVPKGALTTEATVGWGPGSADGTVNGNPVWVTALANTRLYVDYKGDHAGPLTDPSGNKYDTNFTVAALQSQKIFDPSKNQTGMRVYTVDGTLLTAAWGEDPDVAAPGNPYIDAGTTVLPFPVPVLVKSAVIVTDAPPAGLSLNDVIEYTVQVDNKGLLPLGNTVVIDAPTTNLTYVPNSTTLDSNSIPDSVSGTPFPLDAPGYTIPLILSKGTTTFRYRVQVNASGAVSNNVNIGGTTISAQTFIPTAPTNGASCNLDFTDTNGVAQGLYAAGTAVFVTMTNAVGNTSSNSLQTLSVTVKNLTHGDLETVTLTETGTNTGVFRNLGGLATSASAGLAQQDGTLNVAPGDFLSATYTDPNFGDTCTANAMINIPALTKQLYLSVNGSTNGVQALNRVDPVAYGHGPVRTSVDLGGGSGVIALDSVTTVSNTALTATFSHTTSSGANRLMLVGISVNRLTGGATFETPTNVTYAGIPLTLVGGRTNTTSQEAVMWIYALTNPPSGTANVVVKWNQTQTDGDVIGCATFTGVNQSTPYGSFFSSTGTGTAVSLVVNSAPGERVFDTVMLRSSNFGASGSPGANQTALWKTYYNARVGAGASTQAGAATVTNTWTSAASVDWAVGAISIKPAAGGGGSTNVTTFTQTQGFCSNFVMPSNNLVTITNYITVTNGVMPANPAVTAMLQYGGSNIITLSSPTYSSANSNLVWSGVLPGNVTVPAGQVITCVLSNGQSGVAFHIDYDSTNKPSKITLPASTVIAINTLGIYDAPYPGGSLVTAPVAGSTLYVRANVSDPFGSYDITGLRLAITAPVPAANVVTNLNDTSAVANDGCSKTYEFVWNTGPTTGGYAIAATASEGTEGVTNSAGASVTLIFLDLGTPSATEFTSGNNGAATNAYPGSAAGSVYVRVTDLNRNTNAATAETIVATVSSSTGDSEIITLFETATNTGVFTACVNTSTNSVNVPNDGTLYAPVGSILTVSYTDPTDPTDSTSATATVQPAPGVPGVKLNKTLVSPSGGQVGTGQPVTYNLQVVNTGSTTLTNVVVTDNFPSAKLGYSSASPAPGTVAAGVLTWSSLGAFAPGQSTNITVTFTTLATGSATNSATANGGTATNSSSATVLVTHAALNVSKTLLSPTNTPVAIGSNVVFRITIQNTGDTVIPTLPLEDNFSGAYFQFVSATIPPDGTGAGSLIWTNLASPVALATNAVITNDVTMRVVGQGNPANNTAVADYAVDSFGNPVPAATGSTNVVTAAATISGYVYNDKDQSGTLTAGDAPLSGVTVSIYTDPTGTGTPGALVQTTTTSAGGYYELLNLNLGKYVVVAASLPGFAGSAPANGRLAFNLTTLTASANNNFFQYQPSAALYSTFSGTVFNDLNGFGTNTSQAGLGYVTVDLVQDVNSNGVADAGEPVISSATTATNGNYTFAGITPGRYVIRETDPYGYYSSGDAQPPNDNQISFVTTNGVTSTTNYFFDRLSPIAVNDAGAALNFVPVALYPLTNDISPNGDALTITNATSTNGIVAINAGSTSLTFTPTNPGTAAIIYTISDGHGGTSTAVITLAVTELADVAIGKAAPASVPAAGSLTYTISVTNLGPSPANFVVVTDALPAGVSFVSASGNGANNSGVVTWSLGTLASGQVSNVTVTVMVTASGSLTNTANVSSPTGDPNPTNNMTPPVITDVTPVADVRVSKTGPAGVLFGTNFSYTISVTNFGPSTASSVVVTDSLPAGLVFVSSAPATTTNAINQVVWSGLGNLASGACTNLTLTVISTARGTVTNIASGGSPVLDPNPTNNVTPPVVTAITNLPPVANPDGYSMTENMTNTFSPLVNDAVQTPGGGLTIISVSPTNGAASISGTNVIFTPALNFLGTATIGYTITDNVGGTNSSVITVSVTNIPPLANPDSYSLAQNSGTNVLSPLVNDVVRTPGGSLTLISVSPTNGAASISGTNVIFTPATNFLGVATIGYTITDNVGGTSVGLITVNVTNRPPVAVNDSASTPKNVAVTVAVLQNDSDPDGNPLTIVDVSPTNGLAVISGTNVVFTPATNFIGTATVGYSITDSFGGTNSALITIAVTNRPPVALDDSASTPKNVAVTVPVLVNDSDPDNDFIGIYSFSPTNGTAFKVGTNIVFTPDTNFIGLATVGYTIVDGFGGSASAVVTISVTNRPPVAVNDFAAAPENVAVTIPVLANDSDPDGDALTIFSVSPTNGVASIAGTNILFTPATNFVGTATVGYGITDGFGGTNFALVTITVTNIPPVANPDGYSMTENSTNTFSPLVNDVVLTPGGALAIVSVSPTNGIATISGTNVIFTPANNFTGTATIGYVITDGIGGTNSSVITVTVNGLADIAVSKSGPANVQAAADFDYTITVTNLGPGAASSLSVTDNLPSAVSFVSATAGATLNGSELVWTNLGSLAAHSATNLIVTVTAPLTGVSLTNIASGGSPTSDPDSTNNVTPPVITEVTPIANLAIGKTAPASVLAAGSLTYTISVTNFGPSTASSVVVTDALPAGVSFVSASDNGANNSGVVTWNLGDLINGAVSNVTVTVTAPASGSLTNVADVGSPTSDPNPTNNVTPPVITDVTAVADLQIGKVGPASVLAVSNLTYTISVTNFGPSTAASVTVTDALPAGVSFVSASGNGADNSGVVTWSLGDLINGAVSNVTVTVTAPASGSLTNVADVGSPTGDPHPTNNVTPPVVTTVTEQADLALGKSGPAGMIFNTGFSYTISVTNFGPSSASSVTVTDALPAGLVFVGAVPTAVTNAAGEVVWILGSLASGAVTNLTLDVISTQRGSVTNLASGGSPTLDPVPTNNVTPPVITAITNIPPVANPDGYSMTENTTNTFSPLINDAVRTPGGVLAIIAVNPTNGTATISGTNVIFTPALNFLGTATIGYTITDNVGGTNSSVITVTVTNIPPVANPDAYSAAENTGKTLFPLVNDFVQTPGGVLGILGASPTNGTVVNYGTNLVFTPATNFVGTAYVGYTITDGIGGTNTALITIAVTNIPPVANPDSYAVAENSTNTFSPLVNDVVQTPGGSLTIISVSPTNGAAGISGTNVIFTPTTNFIGVATIGYTITDNVGGTNSSVITVNVTNLPPTAMGQSVTTTENTAKALTLTGSDPAGRPLTFIIVNAPTNGALTLLDTNTGAVTYTPGTDYAGADAFTFRVNNGYHSSPAATVAIAVTLVADLVVVESGPTNGVAGSNLVFTVTVTNLGPATATNLVVTNQLSPGFTFAGASASGVYSNNFVTWLIASLPRNGVTNLTVTAFATEGGAFTNIASGASPLLDLNPTNNNGSLPNAQSLTVITPMADVAVFKDGGTNVFDGQPVSYVITATNAGPSTAASVVVQDDLPAGATFQSASGSYSVSNNIVTWSGVTLAPGTVATFNLTLIAPASGSSFLNIASAASPTADPNPTNNNGSNVKSRVVTKIVPSADLVVLLSGPASAIQGSNFVYSLVVTNAGPSVSSNIVVSDSLPTNFVFVSASAGGTASNSVVTWPLISSLAVGGSTNYTVTVRAPNAGTFTNIASALAGTYDPDPTNNTGVLPASQVQTTVALPQFSLLAGRPVFNPQTGLFEESVVVTNNGSITVAGFRLFVGGLRSGVTLWNATGTNGGVPYVDYNFPVNPSNTASLVLEFYNPSRLPFTNTLSVVAIIPANIGTTGTNGSVVINKIFTDTRASGLRFVVEWNSVPGRTYTILYSTNMNASVWNVATPSVTASASVTQWYDDGPPKTDSKPASVISRFYRIIQN